MRYVINRTIHFRNTDGAIWKVNENDPSSITLTVTTSRLLTFLLERHGEVASRDDILETVWTSHGLRSSNNSLNKYIADLRKMFVNLDLDEDVIITVPKIGFMFAREIEVDKESSAIDDEQFDHAPHSHEVVHDNNDQKRCRKRNVYLPFLILFVGAMPMFLSNFGIGIKLSGMGSLPQSNSYLLGNVDGCDIYTLQQSSVDMTNVKMFIARTLIKKTGLSCLENTKVFFQPSDPVVYGFPGRVFLSRCTYNKDSPHKFAACDNFYGINYTNEK
ncbi:winged helix-turn-helix domain-containing protein [Enterobacter mori]